MRPVVIYLDDAPRRDGSGAHLRFFSNVRAWCDLGAEVHLVRFWREDDLEWLGDPELPLSSVTVVPFEPVVEARSSLLARVAYRFGLPTAGAVDFYFPGTGIVRHAMRDMNARIPGALHVMEGESMAVAALGSRACWIWSEHESLSTSIEALQIAEQGQSVARSSVVRARERRFARAAEQAIYRKSHGIVHISSVSAKASLARRYHGPSAFIPMSVADDADVFARPSSDSTAPLRLLHLGSVAHLPTYSSLQFLLAKVFPLLPVSAIHRLRLSVVGRMDPSSPRVKEIAELARRYPEVEFLGFQPSLRAVYQSHDAQVVVSTQAAGLRTRVIESMARGLPVIATPAAVAGVAHLERGTHFLQVDEAKDAAALITRLLYDREILRRVAYEARALYETTYSRLGVSQAMLETFSGLLAGR